MPALDPEGAGAVEGKDPNLQEPFLDRRVAQGLLAAGALDLAAPLAVQDAFAERDVAAVRRDRRAVVPVKLHIEVGRVFPGHQAHVAVDVGIAKGAP